MRNLVTGATGFIGSHLVQALLLRGEEVNALVRPASSTQYLRDMGAEVRLGTLVDQATLMAAAEGVDRIWHCAALVNDWGPPDAFVQANVDGVRNILAVATRAKVKRFVYLSTSDVYGFPGKPTFETVKPAPRGLPYVDSKIEGESLVWNHYRKVNLSVTVVRPGTVYGPRCRALLLPIVTALLERRGYTIDKGRHLAGLCYAGNLVDAMLLAGDIPEAVGQAYNITDGSGVTWARFCWRSQPIVAFKPSEKATRLRMPCRCRAPKEIIRTGVPIHWRRSWKASTLCKEKPNARGLLAWA